VSTRLTQAVPVLSQIDVHVSFRPECFDLCATAGAFQANITPFSVRINPSATAQTLNIYRDKAFAIVTLANEF